MGSQLDLLKMCLADTLEIAASLRQEADPAHDQRAVSLAITKLEEAELWLTKVVKE
jgi:hypothetical protein